MGIQNSLSWRLSIYIFHIHMRATYPFF
jgi:hypothetical protein